MKRINLLPLLLLLSIVLWPITGCKEDIDPLVSETADRQSSEVATRWFTQLRELTKNCPGFTPPVAARAFGYAGVALYESVVYGTPNSFSLGGQLQGLGEIPQTESGAKYHWPAVVNGAMHYMALNLYANMPDAQRTQVEELFNELEQEFAAETDIETIITSQEYGQKVAEVIFEWSKTDGGHEGYLKNFPASYVPPSGPGMWVPTPPAFQKALQPYWGSNRPFIPGAIELSQPPAPKAFSTSTTSPFYVQALETYSAVKFRSPEEEKIARFWSDDPGQPGTPPGHSISIATQVLENENASLALAAETYCKVGMAVSDAFVSCWKCKFDYNLMRPVSYINQYIDPTWTPVLTTPPFPEYTSGHSVQGGATAQILSDLFGYDYVFTDYTHANRTDIDGTPRSFTSFFDMADEAAISRLYGGIHYRDAIDLGVKQGIKIGQAVGTLKFKR